MNYQITLRLLRSTKNENVYDDYNWKKRGTLYKWDKNRKRIFINALQECTEEIEDISQRIDAGLVHSAGEHIQQLLAKTAKATLEVKGKSVSETSKNWKKKKKVKKMV